MSTIPPVHVARGRNAGLNRYASANPPEVLAAGRRVLSAANIKVTIERQLALCGGHLSDDETAELVALLTARG